MLKYVDFWYALKTTKPVQSIFEGVPMETTKARAVLLNKIIIIMLQDSSVDWRFSYLSLFVARSIFMPLRPWPAEGIERSGCPYFRTSVHPSVCRPG